MYYQRKLPSFNTVVAGNTATLQIPIGPTYKQLILKHTANGALPNVATTGTNLARIRMKIDGVTKHDTSGANRQALNAYYGLTLKNGYIVIPLTRQHMATAEGEENTAMGTMNIRTLTLEVDLAAGITTPTLEAWAEIDPISRNLGTIIEVQELNYSASTTAIDFANLPSNNGDLVALHFKNANITDLSLKINSVDVIQNALELKQFAEDQKRVWQTGFVHMDALLQNRYSEVYPLAQTVNGIRRAMDTRVSGTLSAAGLVPIIMETINQPYGPSVRV